MLNINLNSNEFENKSSAPFNGGKAGIVPITISKVEKIKDKDRWEITYTDKNGGNLRDFYNYIDMEHANATKQIKAQGMALRHLWQEIVGKVELPQFSTTVEMLDTIMSTLAAKAANLPFRVAVDYGFGDRHNTNLNRKNYVPFIERVVSDESRLYLSKNAFTEAAKPSNVEDLIGAVKTTPAGADDWLTK